MSKIVFSSSAGVYGEPDSVPDRRERTRPSPVNVYGDTKLVFERVLEWQSQSTGLRYISLRYFNAAGASANCGEDHDPETHLIPIALQVGGGQHDRELTVFGDDYDTPDGTCIRDYIDVRDLSDAHIAGPRCAWTRAGAASTISGTARGASVLDVIETAEAVTGQDGRRGRRAEARG